MKLSNLLLGMSATVCILAAAPKTQEASELPPGPLAFGAFVIELRNGGEFRLEGQGWPAFVGSWKVSGSELSLVLNEAESDCSGPGRYTFKVEEGRLHLRLIADDCEPRRMILDGSTWRPEGEPEPVVERRIELTAAETHGPLPNPGSAEGSWPSFRGPNASGVADKQNLPDDWSGETGKNILWKKPIPGLAHSSPILWGIVCS